MKKSQAVRAAGQIYVSGQIPANPAGALIEGSVGEKTQACCDNIAAILKAAGSGVGRIVKVNVCPFSFFPFLFSVFFYFLVDGCMDDVWVDDG